MYCNRRCTLLAGIATILGVILGISGATLWSFNMIPLIRAIIPHATADALLIIALSTLIVLFYRGGNSHGSHCSEDDTDRSYSRCLFIFVRIIIIAAAVFLTFIQIFVGAVLPFILKVILAFIGSISFWVMFVGFVALVLWIARRR